ncbi:MAG: hypothetical protein JRJ44_09530 [Deltaproteobacteria bacterium]|nr:hypothetical protein [Deltaproteobacteria bacterium]
MNDPIINEIRKLRDEHAKLFNYDVEKICEDYEKKHGFYLELLAGIKKPCCKLKEDNSIYNPSQIISN